MLYDAKNWEPKLGSVYKKERKKKVTKATYRGRLLKLASMLEEDAKNTKGLKFDLDYIGVASAYPRVSYIALMYSREEKTFEAGLDCGTMGCAIGLAALSGQFKDAGLSYKVRGIWVEPTMRGRMTSYTIAAEKVFGLSNDEANYLFSPDYYPERYTKGAAGERYVAKRIRSVVAGTHKASMERWLASNELMDC